MIYLKMIFMYAESKGQHSIFFSMDNQLTHHHFIGKKMAFFFYCLLHYIAFFALNQVYIYKDLREVYFFLLVYIFTLEPNHVKLITVAL